MARWLLFSLLLIIVAGAVSAEEAAQPIPVIIDTDFAADDWMAILFLLNNPDVAVQAITLTGAGEAHCDPGVQNALNLIAMAGHPDIPVACGRETPIEGQNTFPGEWRAAVDAMLGIPLEASEAAPYDGDAVALLEEAITSSEQPPLVLTLGPLTNIAELFTAEPHLTQEIADLVIMGGAVNTAGNVWLGNQMSEWNIYVDPLAADQVIRSGAPVTLVPLDATNAVPLTRAFLRAVEADRTTPQAEFVYQVLKAQEGFISSGGYYFWDPLAAATAIVPELAITDEMPVRVITDDPDASGQTVSDEHGSTIHVAVSVDAAQFERIFRNILNGRAADAELPGS